MLANTLIGLFLGIVWKLWPFGAFAEGSEDAEDADNGGDEDAEEGKDNSADAEKDKPEDQEEENEDAWKDFDAEKAKATIRSQRGYQKKLTGQLKEATKALAEFRKKEQEAEDANKSDLEKAQSEAQAAKDRVLELDGLLEEERLMRQIEREAAKLGFRDPNDAYNLIVSDDAVYETLEYDADNGKVKGLAKALKDLAEGKPYLLGANGPGPKGGTPRKSGKGSADLGKAVEVKPIEEQTPEEALGVNVKF